VRVDEELLLFRSKIDHAIRLNTPIFHCSFCYVLCHIGSDYYFLQFTTLLVVRSRDRSPVVSLEIFSMASDNSMCPGSTQPLKMSTRIHLGVKTAGAYG
jgi:hypothetical protein